MITLKNGVQLPDGAVRYTRTVAMDGDAPCAPIKVVQYDNRLPVAAITLIASGTVYKPPDGATVKVRMRKPDGHGVYNDALGVDDAGVVYITITQQMAASANTGKMVVEITTEGGIKCSDVIAVQIEENPVQEGEIESSDEWLTLLEIIAQVEQLAEQAAASASAAKTSETNAAASKAAAAGSASASKTSETNAKASETAAKTSETNAASSETAAASSASAAKSSETNAANSKTAAAGSASAAKASENEAAKQAALAKDYLDQVASITQGPQGPPGETGAQGPQGQDHHRVHPAGHRKEGAHGQVLAHHDAPHRHRAGQQQLVGACPPLLGQEPHHVVGAGEAAGEHYGNDAVVTLRRNGVQGVGDILSRGQRGMGQFTLPQAAVDVPGADIHAVAELAVPAADAQRYDPDMVLRSGLGGQIRTGVGQQGNFMGRHRSISKSYSAPL